MIERVPNYRKFMNRVEQSQWVKFFNLPNGHRPIECQVFLSECPTVKRRRVLKIKKVFRIWEAFDKCFGVVNQTTIGIIA